MNDKFLPIWGHLEELRRRLLHGVYVWLMCSAVAYHFKDRLFEWFVRPVGQLVFLTPTGAFSMYLKLSLAAGFAAAMPYLIWQAWAFVSPALREREGSAFLKYGIFSLVLFLTGCAMGWWLLGPSVDYLMSFQNYRLVPMITVEAYSSFVVILVIGCGLIWEMPAVFLWLSHLGMVSSYWLIERWRVAVVACVVTAGLVTPSVDVITQALVALPMILLYGVSIACVRWGERRKEKTMLAGT